MRFAFGGPIAFTTWVSATLFIGLNLADAWVTKQLLAHGGGEANAIASAYGSNMLIKGLMVC